MRRIYTPELLAKAGVMLRAGRTWGQIALKLTGYATRAKPLRGAYFRASRIPPASVSTTAPGLTDPSVVRASDHGDVPVHARNLSP